ncbi:MAG: serine/threonine protein kinase [Gemmatimonadaceae bacterium]|nr:serine/threonine protein kinase [Gemmatimonadaceae bacterium]
MREADLYRRVCDVFDAAMELDPSARAAFLDDACRDAPLVRREVESLLASLDGTRTAGLFPPLLRVADPTGLAIGQRIGPYTLAREVGAGGMGVVYQATRDDVGKTVALKLVRHGRLASPEHLRRFFLERRVLARLEHPNIARLLDAGVTDSGLPYLVMEYVDGQPIDQYCDAHRLTVEERLALFAHVCDAVHYAHRHLVVHRDLKPSNIAVTSDGAVKLLDFGIATLLAEGEGGESRLTRTGLVMLTPEYAAPEQVKGEPVTTAADVYALGLLLFELLTGQRPFHREGRTPPELVQAVVEEDPEPPSVVVRRRIASRSGGAPEPATPDAVCAARRTSPQRLSRRLAGDLDTIVLKALRKEPERRYLSAQELRDDIDRHLAERPVRARGNSLWYRSRKFVGRYRVAVAASALTALTLAAGAIATTVQARRAEAERAVAEQRFRDVRALAAALVSDVHDAISDLPGSLPVRATLVTRALEHLDRLDRQSSDDPPLKREIAAAYVELGLVQGNPTIANLGDLAAARRSFERALSIAETLVAADPSDHAARRTLALAHEKLSDADAWGGRLPQAVGHARSALEQWHLLATASPASVSALRAVATSHIKLGDLLGNPNLPNLSDAAGATREYQHALTLLHVVPRDSLSDWTTRRLLALVHERLGSMLSTAGRRAEGIAKLEQALAIREGLVRERGASVNALRDLAVAHQVLCEAHLAAGAGGEALVHCRQGVTLYESLRSADPRNAQSIHDLALGQLSMHKVLAARGELDASLAQLDRSTELLRQLLSSYADNVPAQRDLARGLLFASTVHARLATRSASAPAERRWHRQHAAASFADGQRLLRSLSEHGRLSSEDSALLGRARAALGRMQRNP